MYFVRTQMMSCSARSWTSCGTIEFSIPPPDIQTRSRLDRQPRPPHRVCQRTIPELKDKSSSSVALPVSWKRPRGILAESGGTAGAHSPGGVWRIGGSPKPAHTLRQESGFTVEFSRSGKTGNAIEGQALLRSRTKAGVEIPSACRQGQCGTCKTRVLSGRVQMTAENGLDPESNRRASC